MRKVYYIYNPQTQTYDRIYPTVRQRALSHSAPFVHRYGAGCGQFHRIAAYLRLSVGEGVEKGEQPTAGAVQRPLPPAGRGYGSAAGYTAA